MGRPKKYQPKIRKSRSQNKVRKMSTTSSKVAVEPIVMQKRTRSASPTKRASTRVVKKQKLTVPTSTLKVANKRQIPQVGRFEGGDKVVWDHLWDIAPSMRPKFKDESIAARNIILVRHGQYKADEDEDDDRILTDLGVRQASYTGQRIKAMGIPINNMYFSTMPRAIDTANIIKSYISPDRDMIPCEFLKEGAPVSPVPLINNWNPEPKQVAKDGLRIETAFRKYFHRASPDQTEDSYDVYVCHANVIRYFVCRVLQFPPEAWLRMGVANSSMTSITIESDGTVGLREIGNTGYMPINEVTYN